MSSGSLIDNLARKTSPVIFQGDARRAYRDPAVLFNDGVFHLFFTVVEREDDGRYFYYLGASRSRDLADWSPVRLLTPRDLTRNYSSPGNVIRQGDRWVLCLQTYPTPGNELYGTDDARLWTMETRDFETWSEPRLLAVKGPGVPVEAMGRMIDPFLLRDKDDPGKWWCFYKQNGVSMSWSRDLETWTYFGSAKSGENACVLTEGDAYLLFHSPRTGVGLKRSRNLADWEDEGLLALPQEDWPWAAGRLTAGFVLDGRSEPALGCYLLFFHGTPADATASRETHGEASLAMVWSRDLREWRWPGGAAAEGAADSDEESGIERNLGDQPLAGIMGGLELRPADLVAASTEQLTFKMVARACKGRRLTNRVQMKILRALCKASGNAYHLKDLFNY